MHWTCDPLDFLMRCFSAVRSDSMQVWVHVLASYQVFSHPIFDAVETAVLSKRSPTTTKRLVLRGTGRSMYVVLVTFVAAILPFFADLMGLIGAVGFIPMTFVMPNVRVRPINFFLVCG